MFWNGSPNPFRNWPGSESRPVHVPWVYDPRPTRVIRSDPARWCHPLTRVGRPLLTGLIRLTFSFIIRVSFAFLILFFFSFLYSFTCYPLISLVLCENCRKIKKEKNWNEKKYRFKSYFRYDLSDIHVGILSFTFHINSLKKKIKYVLE